MDEPAKKPSMARNWTALVATPDLMKIICDNLASGGSLIDLCELWQVRYGECVAWITQNKERNAQYITAISAGQAWEIERIKKELKTIGFSNISELLNGDGSIKPVSDWPKEMQAVVSAFEDHSTDSGRIKKLKLWDKTKALEMLGKHNRMFVERVEHSGKLTLEDLLSESNKEPKK